MAPVSTEPCKVVSFLWLLQYHCLLPLQRSCVKSAFSLVAEQLGLLCSSCRRNTSLLQSQHVHCKHHSYKLRQHEAESEGASDPYIWSLNLQALLSSPCVRFPAPLSRCLQCRLGCFFPQGFPDRQWAKIDT